MGGPPKDTQAAEEEQPTPMTIEEAIKIIESQASIESKRELSDDRIINNNETSIEELRLKVKEMNDFYKKFPDIVDIKLIF